ncbi:hypothetical protein MRB53_042165 [Persea americana]|nr:hypothetical protein MRB53_042165 [Persea americana]
MVSRTTCNDRKRTRRNPSFWEALHDLLQCTRARRYAARMFHRPFRDVIRALETYVVFSRCNFVIINLTRCNDDERRCSQSTTLTQQRSAFPDALKRCHRYSPRSSPSRSFGSALGLQVSDLACVHCVTTWPDGARTTTLSRKKWRARDLKVEHLM